MARNGPGKRAVNARDARVLSALRATLKGEVREAESLARYSTYRIGGPATVALPAEPEDVARALAVAARFDVPWFALGLGSNVLLPDEGLEALVIRLGKGLDSITSDGNRWQIGAGLPAPIAARRTAEAGWGGIHKLVGVPGTVGGGVFMNAGCHGVAWSDVVQRVTVVTPPGQVQLLERDSIPFAYRHSGLEGQIVLATEILLTAASPASLTEEVNDLFRWRQEGTPFNKPCCGSVFKNPVNVPNAPAPGPWTAGRLIDAAGLKGYASGGAQVSPLHANYIVNTGNASAADVCRTIEHVQRTVRDRFGVALETEVKVIGPNGRVVLSHA
jgi:UDP-N-acetylmuramate dehydrogenase